MRRSPTCRKETAGLRDFSAVEILKREREKKTKIRYTLLVCSIAVYFHKRYLFGKASENTNYE